MVKAQAILNWVDKIKSQRFAKTVTNTQLLLSPKYNKKLSSKQICKLCSTPGSVLACSQCYELFHLTCLQLTPLDLPLFKWSCSSCTESYEFNYLNTLAQSLQSQTREKTKWLKKLKNQIKKIKKPSKLKKFKQKFPGFVKNGEILYPIDDFLLWSQPDLHKLVFIEFPNPEFPAYPSEYTSDLILICDFLYTFQQIFHGPDLNCEVLYQTLAQNTETCICKHLHIALLKPLVRMLFKSEGYRKSGMLHYLIYKSKKYVKIEKVLEFSYLTFIQHLFTTTIFRDSIVEIDEESFLFFQKISFVEDYYSISARYKLKLLVLIICLLLETTVLNEECNRRLENSLKLGKDLAEAKSVFKGKKTDEVEKVQLGAKIEEIKVKIKAASVRTVPIGQDRYTRNYYIFPWDTTKIYLVPSPKHSNDSPSWSYFSYSTQLSALLSALNPKGNREYTLYHCLESPLPYLPTTYSFSASKYPLHSLETLKFLIQTLHQSISQSLQLPASQSYLKSIDQSDTYSLIPLIINFHQAFSTQHHSDPYKVSRKIFSLWDNSALNGVWESSLKECKNFSEVFLCTHLLNTLVSRFTSAEQVVEVSESKYSVARRSYQQERQNKLKKDFDKDEDLSCFVCKEYGLVILCEKCPKVAHLQCIGLEKLPEGEWLCPTCTLSFKSIRLKQIKY